MKNADTLSKDFLTGLHALSQAAFPAGCGQCGCGRGSRNNFDMMPLLFPEAQKSQTGKRAVHRFRADGRVDAWGQESDHRAGQNPRYEFWH